MPRLASAAGSVVAIWLGGVALAQTNPLATIGGRVTDPNGSPLGEVTVSAASPALQGVRTATTTPAGDFLIPFLPPGDYELQFSHRDFRTYVARRTLGATDSAHLEVRLDLPEVEETLTVTAETPSVVGGSATLSASYAAGLIDRLPVDRGSRGATLLAPGTNSNALGNRLMIAGAMSYENLYLVDGVGVKEVVGGQPRPFPVEDALVETTTSVGAISAEYGRFTGGLVNAVTRSGGEVHDGSLRVTLDNEAWRSLTPYERERLAEDPRDDAVVPTYEGTAGGPVLAGKLWYFVAGRWQETTSAETLAFTDLPYTYRSEETRFQGKLTGSHGARDTLRLSYGEIDTEEENRLFAPAMDYASLSPVETPEDLLSVQYTSVLRHNLFLEAQYSRRRRAPTGLGARSTDRISGTLVRDGSRGGVPWNSPRFCAVCGVPAGELRRAEEGDRGYVLKLSGLLSGPRAGSHHLVLGGEVADELRKSNSFQSGSGFLVTATSARLVDGALYPVFLPGGSTFIDWQPIFELSRGSRFRTVSGFVNDEWRQGSRWSFNLGLRWDLDDGEDQSGLEVSGSDAWSPRLHAAFDPRGDGVWTVDAGYARYVTSLSFQLGDFGTSAGRPARYSYAYNGPAINAGGAPEWSTAEALAQLFAWFDAQGGTAMPLRQAPSIPGLNRLVGPDLAPPTAEEILLGATRRFEGRGSVRVAAMRREYSRQYRERADTNTGTVIDPGSGARYTMSLIGNGGAIERTYEALLAEFDFRFRSRLRFAGSYTLSERRGNFDGDDASPVGGARAETDLYFFPEYGEARWRAPSGPLRGDQRHRLRAWAAYDLPVAERWGRVSLAALQRFDSGLPYGAVGQIDSRPYVQNPGYVGPPARVPYYFEPRGSRRTESVMATDLAVYCSLSPRGWRAAEIFARFVVLNVFDESAQTGAGDTTVLTAANDRRLAPFDPFSEQPVQGVHWTLGPDFGQPLSADDYQQPRTLSISFGLRF